VRKELSGKSGCGSAFFGVPVHCMVRFGVGLDDTLGHGVLDLEYTHERLFYKMFSISDLHTVSRRLQIYVQSLFVLMDMPTLRWHRTRTFLQL